MVYRGWSGHLGKIAPLVITISQPQQRLLYTPNFSFTWPLCGTVCDAPYTHPCIVDGSTRRTNTDKNAFRWLISGTELPLGQKWIFTRPKNVRRRCRRFQRTIRLAISYRRQSVGIDSSLIQSSAILPAGTPMHGKDRAAGSDSGLQQVPRRRER